MIFLDIETQNDWNMPDFSMSKLKISYVGVIDSDDNEFDFWESDMEKLRITLENAKEIVGFNIFSFDMPVIANYLGKSITELPQLDLMHAAYKALGFRPKLDDLANATLGHGKIGHGADAIKYFAQGKLDMLREYCLVDVRITKEIYEFGRDNGYINYFDRAGFKREVAIDWEVGRKLPKFNKDVISFL